MGCGCACLEGKDHCGRLDMDCICPAKNETGPKLLLMANKLKVKYSKEKTGFQIGPEAPCVGDVDANAITTKLWKVGTKQQAWLKA